VGKKLLRLLSNFKLSSMAILVLWEPTGISRVLDFFMVETEDAASTKESIAKADAAHKVIL
jgi:hypothetical protein